MGLGLVRFAFGGSSGECAAHYSAGRLVVRVDMPLGYLVTTDPGSKGSGDVPAVRLKQFLVRGEGPGGRAEKRHFIDSTESDRDVYVVIGKPAKVLHPTLYYEVTPFYDSSETVDQPVIVGHQARESLNIVVIDRADEASRDRCEVYCIF